MTTTDLAAALRELDSPWMDTAAAAAYLRVNERHFRERLQVRPTFPQPRRKAGVGLRWHRAELDAWMNAQD